MDSYNDAVERELARLRSELKRTREVLRRLVLDGRASDLFEARQLLGLAVVTQMKAA